MDFEDIYKEHFFGVYKYILSLCRDTTLAEEITQETFYRAMESFHRFRGDSSLFVWLCQIAKNTWYRHARRQKHILSEIPEDMPPGTEVTMEERLSDREDAKRLHRLLHDLPEPYREVFYTESGDVDPIHMDGPVTLGWNQYFVLGDNHENALDSRYSQYGFLSENDILGKVQFIFKRPSLSPHISVPADPVE